VIWAHDVLAFRGRPAAWAESRLWVSGATCPELPPTRLTGSAGRTHPVAVTLSVGDGPAADVVTSESTRRLLGPCATSAVRISQSP
jgi:hypothetical protein